MIALDPIVAPFLVDVPDVVEIWVVAIIDLVDDKPIGLRLVSHDSHGSMQSHALNCRVEKGLGSFRIPPCGEAEIDHLTVCMDRPPQVTPLASNADVSLISMPVDAGPAQMLLGSFGQFWAELLNPAIHGRPINTDHPLGQQIHNVLIGQRVTQIPPHRTKDELARKPVML